MLHTQFTTLIWALSLLSRTLESKTNRKLESGSNKSWFWGWERLIFSPSSSTSEMAPPSELLDLENVVVSAVTTQRLPEDKTGIRKYAELTSSYKNSYNLHPLLKKIVSGRFKRTIPPKNKTTPKTTTSIERNVYLPDDIPLKEEFYDILETSTVTVTARSFYSFYSLVVSLAMEVLRVLEKKPSYGNNNIANVTAVIFSDNLSTSTEVSTCNRNNDDSVVSSYTTENDYPTSLCNVTQNGVFEPSENTIIYPVKDMENTFFYAQDHLSSTENGIFELKILKFPLNNSDFNITFENFTGTKTNETNDTPSMICKCYRKLFPNQKFIQYKFTDSGEDIQMTQNTSLEMDFPLEENVKNTEIIISGYLKINDEFLPGLNIPENGMTIPCKLILKFPPERFLGGYFPIPRGYNDFLNLLNEFIIVPAENANHDPSLASTYEPIVSEMSKSNCDTNVTSQLPTFFAEILTSTNESYLPNDIESNSYFPPNENGSTDLTLLLPDSQWQTLSNLTLLPLNESECSSTTERFPDVAAIPNVTAVYTTHGSISGFLNHFLRNSIKPGGKVARSLRPVTKNHVDFQETSTVKNKSSHGFTFGHKSIVNLYKEVGNKPNETDRLLKCLLAKGRLKRDTRSPLDFNLRYLLYPMNPDYMKALEQSKLAEWQLRYPRQRFKKILPRRRYKRKSHGNRYNLKNRCFQRAERYVSQKSLEKNAHNKIKKYFL